ncbi:hypothetical protein N7G274_009327 [Stereocaulon virgatum]|uniref:Uncharacterized protein n=1 Tax=Stereocaulon virgatum TaxID=373712 RepID=A0ABR4A3E8_9LECA
MSGFNQDDTRKEMANIAEAAQTLNARRARETRHAHEHGAELARGSMSLGVLTFTRARKRGGRMSKETPLSEDSEAHDQQPSQFRPQLPLPLQFHPYEADPADNLQQIASTSNAQQQATGDLYGFSEAPPSPSPTSPGPGSPRAVYPPAYPLKVLDPITKEWVPNPVLEWQASHFDMSGTPRAVRGQASAQYGVQSSSLNPNVTPSSRERLPYGRYTHSISPSSESCEPTMDRPGPTRTGSSGNFFDPSGSGNEDPFNDQYRGSSAHGQSTFAPGAFGYQPTFSSIPVSAYNSRNRMYNHFGQQQQQALAGIDPYGTQSPYDPHFTGHERYPAGPHFTGNEQYTAGPQYAYAQQSAYGTQSFNDPYAGIQMSRPAVRGTSQVPQGNASERSRLYQAEQEALMAHFARLGARDNKKALEIYMNMPPDEQTKLLDACRHRAFSATDSNPADQAALATPNVRDSAPYTGFNASIAQESQNQANTPRSVRTVAHDPLAQTSSNAASSVATSSTIRPHALGYAQSSEQAGPKTRDEVESQPSRKIAKPGPGLMAYQKYANDLTNKLVNEIRADPGMMSYTNRDAMPPARAPLAGDGPSKLHGFGRSRGVRRTPPPEPVSMGAGNVALREMMQKKKKTPEESLKEGARDFREGGYDLIKDLYESARKAGLNDASIRSCGYGQSTLPGDQTTASATSTPHPIGHGRPSSIGASPIASNPSPATNATNATRPPWSELSPEAMQHLLIGAMANLASHKNPKADDPFNRYSQPPAHAIDHSAAGNDSFFDEEWAATNPPARVGRDPRYQSEDGRTTYFEESNRSGRGSSAAFGRR